jgi:NAD-dependent SIR2 family protein deacetylase
MPNMELNGMIERSESMSGAGEAGANLSDLLGVTYHKKCHDCGRFLPHDRWVRTDDRRKAHGLCHDCYSLYDDQAFL